LSRVRKSELLRLGWHNRARQSEMAGTKTNAFVPRTAMTSGDDEAAVRCLAARPCTRKFAMSAIAPTAAKKRTSFQVRFVPLAAKASSVRPPHRYSCSSNASGSRYSFPPCCKHSWNKAKRRLLFSRPGLFCSAKARHLSRRAGFEPFFCARADPVPTARPIHMITGSTNAHDLELCVVCTTALPLVAGPAS